MEDRTSFMKQAVTLKRWHLYALRFGVLVFAWAFINLAVLSALTEAPTRTFVVPEFVLGMGIALTALTAVYGVETNSKKVKISIAVVLVALAIFFVTLKIMDSLAWH